MVKVPVGGRKKKLKQSTPATEASNAGQLPQAVATRSTTSK
jgi:hypothetical protein